MAELEISNPRQEPEGLDSGSDNGAAMPANFDYGVDDSGKRKVSVIEQCLAWGGEQRLRLVLTLSVGGLSLSCCNTIKLRRLKPFMPLN